MTQPACSEAVFIEAFQRLGSPEGVAKYLGISVRSVYKRRNNIEKRTGQSIASWVDDRTGRTKINLNKIGARQIASVKSGQAIVFGDAHFWPGDRSTAFDALVHMIRETQPKLIICNGDAFDGARISRHPPTEWADMPTVAEELEAVQERLAEIESVAPKKTPLVWTMGNHDSRFSMRLAQAAPEFMGVKGFDLPDHFPAWSHSWSCDINENTIAKHRWHGGIHATWNNVLKSGRNIITNHLHQLCIKPFTDYNGRRYGVDTGTLSDFGPDVQKFTYGEDNPFNWGQGFAVLTFNSKGELLPPELCEVSHNTAYFRGEAISVAGRKAMKKAAA